MKCDIVMPVWNNKELTSQCLDSVFENTDCDYRVIIIDNASDESTLAYLNDVKNSHPDKIALIRNQVNLGFTKAVNQGIANSSDGYVCILNNDVIVFSGWLSEMMRIAESSKDIGIVNPSNNFGAKKPRDKTLEQYAKDKTDGKKGLWVETATPVGFCYLIKREVINRIGMFDERFNPGYFEDTEYALRARAAGYKAVFAKGAFVFHIEHTSFKKRGLNRFFKQSEEKFYEMHKRPKRALFVLSKYNASDYEKVSDRSAQLADKGAWVLIYLKKSAPKIQVPNHTHVRAFYFTRLFFNAKILFKILFKKKRFTDIFVDKRNFLSLLKKFKKWHTADVYLV